MTLNENQREMYKNCMFLNEGHINKQDMFPTGIRSVYGADVIIYCKSSDDIELLKKECKNLFSLINMRHNHDHKVLSDLDLNLLSVIEKLCKGNIDYSKIMEGKYFDGRDYDEYLNPKCYDSKIIFSIKNNKAYFAIKLSPRIKSFLPNIGYNVNKSYISIMSMDRHKKTIIGIKSKIS